MKKKPKMNIWLALLAFALSLSAITFATARILRHKSAATSASPAQNAARVTNGKRNAYIRRAQLSPRLALNLGALGNRLEKPGARTSGVDRDLASSRGGTTTRISLLLWNFQTGCVSLSMVPKIV